MEFVLVYEDDTGRFKRTLPLLHCPLPRIAATFELLEVPRGALHPAWTDWRARAYPNNVFADDDASRDERSLAHMVRGILDLSGLKFDSEGRLL
jgi:hypothetical protein